MSSDQDLASVQQARDLVEAAAQAGVALARFEQAHVDRVCAAMSRAALDAAARLGALAVEETGYGVAADKREKNRFAAEDVWNFFRDLRTVGVVAETDEIIEVVSPRGVIAAIIPSTNPTSTAIFKILIAIKSRNPVVLSPHPSAARSITETADVLRRAAVAEGLPAEAIGCMSVATIEGTEALMKHKRTALILATGGMGLVRAAYSSGKPAFGVGPGNVPVFVERTARLPKAIADILTGKCFDNGTICASEQAVVADAPIHAQVREEFRRQGAHFLSAAEADQLGRVVATAQRTLNPAVVGKSALVIAQMAGLTNVPSGTRCLIADVGGVGRDFPLSMEKLSPILAFYVEDGTERAAARCNEILHYGGMGHTAGIHTASRDVARRYGTEMPASRIIVNSPTTHGAIGFSTALAPSMTLGCGSWGGNVSSDNISPRHLMDIKRIAFETRPVNAAQVESGATKFVAKQPPAAAMARAATHPAADRNQIVALVDRFLANRTGSNTTTITATPQKTPPLPTAPPPPPAAAALAPPIAAPKSAPTATTVAAPAAPAASSSPPAPGATAAAAPPVAAAASPAAAGNGHRRQTVDFVCEDDVKRALARGEKIYVNRRTIITPAARDIRGADEVLVDDGGGQKK